jgi:hypothetical protein
MEQLSPMWSVAAYAGVVIVAGVVQWMTRGRDADRLEGAVAGLRVLVLAFSAAALVLWFSLPSTPVLSSFGYPKTVSDLSPPGRLLTLLQDYNRAIVRTTEVVHWFLFLFLFGLVVPAMFILMPAVRAQSARNQEIRNEQLEG